MRYLDSKNFAKIIQEAISKSLLDEAGMPFKPLGNGGAAPAGGGMPFKPLGNGGGAAPTAGGGMPFSPLGNGGAQNNGGGMPFSPLGAGSSAPVNEPEVDDEDQEEDSTQGVDDGKGGKDYHPAIFDGKYDTFYETSDPNEVDQEVLKLWISYVHNMVINDCVTFLNQNYGDIVFSPMPLRDPTCHIPKNYLAFNGKPFPSGFDKYWLKIVIKPGKTDEFLQKIPEIVNGFYAIFDKKFGSGPKVGRPIGGGGFQGNKGKIVYGPQGKADFESKLTKYVKNVPSPEEVNQVKLNIAQTVKELLANLKDPEIQKRLGKVTVLINRAPTHGAFIKQNRDLIGNDQKLSGWLLSPRNAALVIAQCPNATYVAQEGTWNQFGHEVIDPSKYILIKMPTTWKNHDDKAFDRACKAFGFKGGAADYEYAKKNGGTGLSRQQRAALEHLSNLYNPNATEFGWRKFYDVSNTRVMQGKESTFLPGNAQERGLSDNVLGGINVAAGGTGEVPDLQNATSNAPSSAEATANGNTPESIEKFRDILAAEVSRETQSGPAGLGESAERDIVKLAYHYAEYLIRTSYKQLSLDETAEAFKQGFAAAVAVAAGITDDEAATYLSNALSNQGKDSKIDTLIYEWFGDYLSLLNRIQNALWQSSHPQKYSRRKVVEEGFDGENIGIKPLNFNSFKNIMLKKLEQNGYEIQNDAVNQQQLQESFFRFLDKMDGR